MDNVFHNSSLLAQSEHMAYLLATIASSNFKGNWTSLVVADESSSGMPKHLGIRVRPRRTDQTQLINGKRNWDKQRHLMTPIDYTDD